MARITPEQLQRLQVFLDTLPDEARSKCSLCNSTLTHIVKQAEAETGVGTATAARVLAEKVNETALPADRVTAGQLRDRVRRSAGEKEFGRFAQIKQTTKAKKIAAVDELKAASAQDQVLIPEIVFERGKKAHKHGKRGSALLAAEQAIGALENIADDDPERYEAFNLVRTWMDSEEAACSRK